MQRARAIADDLSDLAMRPDARFGPSADQRDVAGNLTEGWPGIAVFLDAAGFAFTEPRYSDAAERCRARAAHALEQTELSMGLFSGFTGISWCINAMYERHLRTGSDGSDVVDPCDEIDAFLLDVLRASTDDLSFDVMEGVAGIAIYALDRMRTSDARPLLEACVDQLDRLGHRLAHGTAWRLRLTDSAPEFMRVAYPDGAYPLGAAHGLVTVVAALAQIVVVLPGHTRARALLDDGIRFLLHSRLPGRPHYSFPRLANDHKTWPDHSELSWCWGDPGIALCLLSAGNALGNRELVDIAAGTMRALCETDPASSALDASICHGWSGIAHIFGRFYAATGDDVFGDAARRWFETVLAQPVDPECLGGFRFRAMTVAQQVRVQEHPGLLTGVSGVGLALLAGCGHENDLQWDGPLGFVTPLFTSR
jgi:lantibiotic modifying enzyme